MNDISLQIASVGANVAGGPAASGAIKSATNFIDNITTCATEWADLLGLTDSVKEQAERICQLASENADIASGLQDVATLTSRLDNNASPDERKKLQEAMRPVFRVIADRIRASYDDWKAKCGLVRVVSKDGATRWVKQELAGLYRQSVAMIESADAPSPPAMPRSVARRNTQLALETERSRVRDLLKEFGSENADRYWSILEEDGYTSVRLLTVVDSTTLQMTVCPPKWKVPHAARFLKLVGDLHDKSP